MLMVIYMRATGLTTRLTATVFTYISMGQDMKASGEMIYNMVKAKKLGLMVLYMRVITFQERSMDTECTVGTMDQGTKESGLKTRLGVSVLIHG